MLWAFFLTYLESPDEVAELESALLPAVLGLIRAIASDKCRLGRRLPLVGAETCDFVHGLLGDDHRVNLQVFAHGLELVTVHCKGTLLLAATGIA